MSCVFQQEHACSMVGSPPVVRLPTRVQTQVLKKKKGPSLCSPKVFDSTCGNGVPVGARDCFRVPFLNFSNNAFWMSLSLGRDFYSPF